MFYKPMERQKLTMVITSFVHLMIYAATDGLGPSQIEEGLHILVILAVMTWAMKCMFSPFFVDIIKG
jgi:hypothetical protein